ncbi:nacht and ankyrin domain-containing protein [Daldinia bambusicola]|nr:nacht and ankyrin domain-containing protein [Daldinia bambusicola]
MEILQGSKRYGNSLGISGRESKIPVSSFHQKSTDGAKAALEHRRKALESLRFVQMDERRNNIKRAHTKTYEWLLETQEFIDWLNVGKFGEHEGFLWIKGKPGAGKSTLMKSTISHVYQPLKERGNRVISFFFNARGETLEKSVNGLYRSLLFQLLTQDPALHGNLDGFDLTIPWGISMLKTLFENTVLAMKKVVIICFIDGLDECEEQQIRDMLYFLRNIGRRASLSRTRLHICFASRHYPHITIPKGLILTLECRHEHGQDINKYLKDELRIGEDSFADRIRSDVQEKASGVFMWVVLVVDILNKEYDRGRKHTLERRLQEIPSDLHDLFKEALTRDNHNKDGLLLCIQWILFATRPMRLEELYFAIISGIEDESLAVCHEEDTISPEDMRKYIIDCSKGLAEISQRFATVQFIHESVRDFLLKQKGLQKLWPEQASNPHGFGHDRLKQCCLAYMRYMFVGGHFLIDVHFPLLNYATENILIHTERAEQSGVTQREFISKFPVGLWIECNNKRMRWEPESFLPSGVEVASSPILPSILEPFPPEASLLYILASLNLPHLIQTHATGHSPFAAESTRYGTPIFAALARGSNEAIKVLLKMQMQSITSKYQVTKECGKGRCKGLFNSSFKFLPGKGVLYYVLESGSMLLFEAFLASEKIVPDFELLQLALNGGHEFAARKVIDQVLTLEFPDKEPLLVTATRKGLNIGFIQLLLDKGLDVNGNRQYRSPLQEAVLLGDMKLVQFFIEKGANIEGNKGYRSPLREAVLRDHKGLIQLLFQNGANIEGDEKYMSPLQDAVIRGRIGLVQLLLEKGANVEGCHCSTSPLLLAIGQGYADIVQLLLRKGASANVPKFPNSPLALAIKGGHEAMAELLLNRGVRDEPWALVGSRLLVRAAGRRQARVVSALLASGIEISDHDIPFENLALSLKDKKDRAIIQLLERNYLDARRSNRRIIQVVTQPNKARAPSRLGKTLRNKKQEDIDRNSGSNSAPHNALTFINWRIKRASDISCEMVKLY